jgi:hypothetical protein
VGPGAGSRVVAAPGDHTAAIVAVAPGAGVLAGGVVADCLGHVLPSGLVGHGAGDQGEGVGVAVELAGGVHWWPRRRGHGGPLGDAPNGVDHGELVAGTGTGGIPCGTGGAGLPRRLPLSGRPEAPGCDEMS